jgi:8-oxo-dGTP pyrophosphatase MutT (NUDIX family)
LPDHAGQISLPGGVVEPGESSREAALRELEEELGVSIDEVRLLGSLSNVYVFNSNYDVAVHVAAAVVRPRFRPSRDEVAELLEIPINELADPRSVRVVMHERRSLRFQTPGYQWRERHVWGATAMILAELLAVIRPLQL